MKDITLICKCEKALQICEAMLDTVDNDIESVALCQIKKTLVEAIAKLQGE